MEQFLTNNPWVMILLSIWAIPWKAVALWRAARNDHKIWFGALLLVNTVGLLEMIYIFFFSKKVSKKGVKNER